MNSSDPSADSSLRYAERARRSNLPAKEFGKLGEDVFHVQLPNKGIPLLYLQENLFASEKANH